MSKYGKIKRCPCELSVGGCKNPFLSYRGPKEPRILVIGDAPQYQDDKVGKLFSSANGRYFRQLLEGLGVDLHKVGYTNVVSCYWDEPPKSLHIKSCAGVLTKTLKETASSVELVILLGKLPIQVILNKTGVAQLHGKIHKIQDVYFLPLFSAEKIAKDSKTREKAIVDIRKALSLLDMDIDTLLDWEMVDAARLEEIMSEMLHTRKLTFDTETTSLDVTDSQQYLIGIGFCWDGHNHKGLFVPLEHPELRITVEEYQKRVELLKEIFRHKVKKEAYNTIFDMKWVSVGLDIPVHDIKNIVSDPFHEHHFIDETAKYPALSDLVAKYLPDMLGYDSEIDVFKVKYGINFALFPLEAIAKYCVGDCVATWRLPVEHFDEILQRERSYDLYRDVLIPSLPVYAEMNLHGVRLDLEYGAKLEKIFEKKIEQLEKEIEELPICKMWKEQKGSSLNTNSPVQLMELLYDIVGMPEQTKRVKKDGRNEYHRTSEADALETLSKMREIKYREGVKLCSKIVSHRKFSKFAGTYVYPRVNWYGADGLVHTEYNPSGTVTGRAASSKPNLQNLPKKESSEKTELTRWLKKHPIRKMFISKFEDGYLVESDYSQLELRIMAALSGDKVMVGTYLDGLNDGDIHKARARIMFPNFDNESPEEQERLRYIAKTNNFSSTYSLNEEFLAAYPGLKIYVDKVIALALTTGYVCSIFERRRRLPNLLIKAPKKLRRGMSPEEKDNYWKKHGAIKQAVNHGIQGPSHEILEMAMVRVNNALREAGLRAHLILEVHDSLVVDSPAEERFQVAVILKREMEAVADDLEWMTVPLLTEVKIGRNWHDMEEWEVA